MADHIQHVRHLQNTNGNLVSSDQVIEDRDLDQESAHQQNVAARVVWYIAGVLLILLAFRFVFALMGANPANGFANFIYTTSHPFVAPFFGIFNYNLRYGVSRFESFTLVAIVVYALIAFGITKLLTINRPENDQV